MMMKPLLLNIELSRAFLLKFLKFGVVGFSGVLVNFGVTYLCKERLRWNKYLSNILGFVVAATTNYILNRLWTFQSDNPQIGVEYVKYFAIALVGLGLDTLTVYLLNGKLKWNFYLSKVFAVGVSTLWNFFGNLMFTFA
jgi:putative flippase GtrA